MRPLLTANIYIFRHTIAYIINYRRVGWSVLFAIHKTSMIQIFASDAVRLLYYYDYNADVVPIRAISIAVSADIDWFWSRIPR